MRHIKPVNNNGSIQIKTQVGGHSYRFNPVPHGSFDKPADLERAKTIALQMALDLTQGRFDTTLESYRVSVPVVPIKAPKTLLELWDLWVLSLDLPKDTKADHYEMVRRQIVKSDPKLIETLWFTRCTLAPSTFNSRLGFLVRCLTWGQSGNLITVNPWLAIKPRKVIKKQVKPFSRDELRAILEGFRVRCAHYRPFVAFLMATGCRLSEGIGLQWKDIDFGRGTLTIGESLSILRSGNGYKRLRKETKKGTTRTLGISGPLGALLGSLGPSKGLEALVFLSPKGHHIGTSALRDKWRLVLKDAGIPYRGLHTLRHTCLSMALEEGTSLTGVAYLAGHRTVQMVISTYGHLIDRPSLPKGCLVGFDARNVD
jgi:integrase